MLNIIRKLKVDSEKAENGIWVPLDEGIEFLIARKGSKKWNEVFTRLTETHREEIEAAAKDENSTFDFEDIVIRCFAEAVLLDWKGLIEEDDDSEVPYSIEKSYEILKELPELLDRIVLIASDMDNYLVEFDKASTKNL